MRGAISRVVKMSAGVASALLLTLTMQGPASAQDAFSAMHGTDYATVFVGSGMVYVHDRENDGNDVVGQVRWWDSYRGVVRVHPLWDRAADGNPAVGIAPGPVRGIRVCEDTGDCSPWDQ